MGYHYSRHTQVWETDNLDSILCFATKLQCDCKRVDCLSWVSDFSRYDEGSPIPPRTRQTMVPDLAHLRSRFTKPLSRRAFPRKSPEVFHEAGQEKLPLRLRRREPAAHEQLSGHCLLTYRPPARSPLAASPSGPLLLTLGENPRPART